MSTAIWRLTVKSEFCAAHALRHYKGKCENLHGHNYLVEAVVEGNKLNDETELLLDFGELKKLLRDALLGLDHAYLNDIAPFDKINPSAENLARHIWQKLVLALPAHVRLYSVTVAEKDQQSATYMEILSDKETS
jgi:6-pyruvoyltetrahydropterin/6-carboxytetrahydropterin synthase